MPLLGDADAACSKCAVSPRSRSARGAAALYMPPVLVALVHHAIQRVREQLPEASQSEARAIRTPNLLIWSQTRCHCAIAPSAMRSGSSAEFERVAIY